MSALLESFWVKIIEILIAMIFTVFGVGCISPPDDASVQEQIEAQSATFSNITKALADAGVTGTIIMDCSMDGHAGMFNGFIWKAGPKLMAVLDLNPENVQKLKAILDKQGKEVAPMNSTNSGES